LTRDNIAGENKTGEFSFADGKFDRRFARRSFRAQSPAGKQEYFQIFGSEARILAIVRRQGEQVSLNFKRGRIFNHAIESLGIPLAIRCG